MLIASDLIVQNYSIIIVYPPTPTNRRPAARSTTSKSPRRMPHWPCFEMLCAMWRRDAQLPFPLFITSFHQLSPRIPGHPGDQFHGFSRAERLCTESFETEPM